MPSPSQIPLSRWARVRLFAMDVDGILTDGAVYVGEAGAEFKRFSVRDGLGLGRVRDAGMPLAWISGRASVATTARAGELRIPHLVQGRRDKLPALEELCLRLGLGLDACVYMGDDVIDAAALAAAGIGVTVPGAEPAARKAADCVTRHAAGDGAVREVCDRLLEALARGGRSAR
jgi:3-deoxy-D-manno-octulosonate 8-phosphate phosphatase (KDO 8-P phosphatase)